MARIVLQFILLLYLKSCCEVDFKGKFDNLKLNFKYVVIFMARYKKQEGNIYRNSKFKITQVNVICCREIKFRINQK